MDELIGKMVGPYTISEKIGEGGMAVVYKGYQESLNRFVAIKVLRGELAHDQEFIARFRREALAVAKLSHPNILHVYDAGSVEGMHYIAMDWVDGGSLKEVVQEGTLDVDTANSIGAQLADALDYAHREGLVHRDVKPSNVLMTRDGRPLLTDFGIAKVLHQATHLTRTGTSIGTPEYMSPEQLQGQPVDGRTDIYALGAVLFEMLTGWSPFTAPTPMAIMYKQMNEPPPPLRQINISIPEWLEAVVNKALAKQPADRYQRASEMATALRQSGATGTLAAAPAAAGAAAATGAAAVATGGGRMTPQPGAAAPTVVGTGTAAAAEPRQRSAVPILVGLIAIVILAVAAGAAFLFLGGGTGSGDGPTPTTLVVVASPEPTDTLAPTAVPTAVPTEAPTSEPTAEEATQETVIVVVTATPEPTLSATDIPVPTEAPPTQPPPTEAPTEAPTATVAPTAAPTKAPTKAPPPSEPGVVADFESFGSWRRGDQANGTFTQSNAQAHQGTYSGKLDYTFGSSDNDYVVFERPQSISGKPTRISSWIYGDGSGHFLNAWIKDNGGQVWQVPLGTVDHSGWQQMQGAINTDQAWPWTHISGTDNGQVDYPISFQALVLDDKPDTFNGKGTIYVDDLRADTGTVSTQPGPSPTKAAGQPTSPPSSGGLSASGRIAYSAGGAMHIVDVQTGKDMVAPIGGMFQPDFRADGQQIIANGEGGGKTSIWTINANNGAFIREQSPFTNDFRPFWAPDGGQFAYDSYHQGGKFANDLMLYRQTLDSKDDQFMEHGGAGILGSSPVWMHDDWIAFTGCDYWPGGSGGSKCGIWRMPSWNGRPAVVRQGGLNMKATDNYGGQLVYMSQESGDWEVHIMPNTGGAPKNLSNSPSSHDGLATFSPDGKLVAFASNRGGGWAMWVVRSDGSGLTKLFNLVGKPSGPAWDWHQESISWGP